MQTFGFGGPTEVTSGGNALKFYSSVRMNIKRIGFVKKGEEVNTALYLYIACLYVKGGNIGIFGRSCL